MALSITTLESAYFSSQVPDITINTSVSSAMFILSRIYHGTARDTYTVFFSTSYYVVNGQVTVNDVRTIIENYMLTNDLPVGEFNVEVRSAQETVTHDFAVVYCKQVPQGISAQYFLDHHFLSSESQRFITPDAEIPLQYYLTFNEADRSPGSYRIITYTYRIVLRLADGTMETYTSHTGGRGAWGLRTFNIKLANIRSILGYTYTNYEILSFSVIVNGRRATFYVDNRHSQRQFYFRNAFNVWELAIIPASQKTLTETESSMAQCGDTLIPYDIEHKRTFEVQTAPLLLSHAKWMEQLVTSREIRVKDTSGTPLAQLPQILIVDYTFEVDDAPGAINTFNFTWKYANLRSYINLSHVTAGIFSEQFTEQFL